MPANQNWSKRADAMLDDRAVQQLNNIQTWLSFRLHLKTSWSHILRRSLDSYAAEIAELMDASPMKGALTLNELSEQQNLRASKVSRPAVPISPDLMGRLSDAVDLALLTASPEMKAEIAIMEAARDDEDGDDA